MDGDCRREERGEEFERVRVVYEGRDLACGCGKEGFVLVLTVWDFRCG